ncbi:MAG TPA: DUF1501 domain-containing protein [Rhizomicrobium sp.]|nr:DUF1501 domain-containing protein [Rhizomicrobium sp.]
MTTRRSILKTMTAASALALWDAPFRFAFANVPTDRRLVVVILRGALDGLAALPPHGDKDYASTRGILALDAHDGTSVHDLDGFWGLNPGLSNLKGLYDAKEAVLFQNICSPYHDRSHFEGQNCLETGGSGPHVMNDGWLNRALTPMGLNNGTGAVAIEQSPPLLLTGKVRAASWMPSAAPSAQDDAFLKKVRAMYGSDPALASSLDGGLSMEADMKANADDPNLRNPKYKASYGNLVPLFRGAGQLLAAADGPRVAVLDASGWDTHITQGGGDGVLARRLQALDQSIAALKAALGPVWKKTAVVMATEFGRTVRPNGAGGTDHGTGAAAFLFGGAVSGGHVRAEWVGLKPAVLKDGRDLPPRTDLRALFKGVLAEHMGVSQAALQTTVFPDSGSVAPMKGLIRA